MSERTARFDRLRNDAGNILMVPMDHGISIGPVPGIAPPEPTLDAVADAATCATVHKGLIPRLLPYQDRLGVLMHLSASTDVAPDPNDKRIVGTVEEAVALGADAVSVHINLGSPTEADQLEQVGRVTTDCTLQQVPCIAMIYPRGPQITNPFDPDLVAHAARLGAELGCDAVKVPYTGDPDSFRSVVDGAGVPIIIAGGPKQPDFDAFLQSIAGAAEAGAAGVSIGRNVFQRDDPRAAIESIAALF